MPRVEDLNADLGPVGVQDRVGRDLADEQRNSAH
jgi:hypothetical protein